MHTIRTGSLLPKWCHCISIEPAMMFYFITETILEYTNTNLYLQKSCRDNTTSEVSLDTPCDDEKRGILFVSVVESNSRYVLLSAQYIYLIVASHWSDAAGKKRKPLILLPITGQIMQIILACLHSYFWYWDPVAAVITNVLFQVAFGGSALCLNMCGTYLSDTTSIGDRTMRLGILSALEMLCVPVANGMAGWLLHNFGFMNTYLLGLASTTLALVLGYLLIEDNSVPVEKPPSWISACNPMCLVDSLKTMFQKKLGGRRKIVAVLSVAHVFVWFPYLGEMTVFYLYFRYRFHWDEETYGYYYAYRIFGSVVGILLCTIIVSKYWKVHDCIIGAVTAFCDGIASLAYVFADKPWQIYLIPVLGMFRGTTVAIHFSYLSKFYDSSELGRLSAGLNLFSLIIPVCCPLYNALFRYTIDTFPSAFCLLSLTFNSIVGLLYSVSWYWSKQIESQK